MATDAGLELQKASLERVVDGDTQAHTIYSRVFGWRPERIRLLEVNTPEVYGATKEAGLAAKNFVIGWYQEFDRATNLSDLFWEKDSFGRWLGYVKDSLDISLNETLISLGYSERIPLTYHMALVRAAKVRLGIEESEVIPAAPRGLARREALPIKESWFESEARHSGVSVADLKNILSSRGYNVA